MSNRVDGTKVHTTISAGDSTALLPLQEALGYDLAQSLFMQTKNLILEGLTDYWYLITIAGLVKDDGKHTLDEKIALVPASSASKVVYFATILHAHDLKVAALLDSDNAGDQAAKQDTLVNALGNKNIIRTKDVYKGLVVKSEIEDLFRNTLVDIAKTQLGWDVESTSVAQPSRSIIDIFSNEITEFSKYRLAKAFIKWSEKNGLVDLRPEEIQGSIDLLERINKALK
jgi:predicted ATP-dependent endonuclease of OLD family